MLDRAEQIPPAKSLVTDPSYFQPEINTWKLKGTNR
jgi:hypothetical protein